MKNVLLSMACLMFSTVANASACSWNNPGQDPYMGSVPDAVRSFKELSPATRDKLIKRMEARAYDEVVTIRRNAIIGESLYRPEIRKMHFGSAGKVCDTVDRTKWGADIEERGLVYCEGETCVLVPTVCRNVSLIQRVPAARKEEPPRIAIVEPPPVIDAPVSGGGGGGSATFETTVYVPVYHEERTFENGTTYQPHYDNWWGWNFTWPTVVNVTFVDECCCIPVVPPPVTEPAAALLFAAGLGAIVLRRRFRR